MDLRIDEVWFIKPSHSIPFIILVDNDRFLDVGERLLCLNFDIKPRPLVIVERKEFDENMILMLTIFQRLHTYIPRWSSRITP